MAEVCGFVNLTWGEHVVKVNHTHHCLFIIVETV